MAVNVLSFILVIIIISIIIFTAASNISSDSTKIL